MITPLYSCKRRPGRFNILPGVIQLERWTAGTWIWQPVLNPKCHPAYLMRKEL